MGSHQARRRQLVERYWEAHFARDWDAMAGFFAAHAHYTDVGAPGEGATGPDQIIRRLKIGIEPLERYEHRPRHVIAEGDLVVTEHVELWGFGEGHELAHPFTSVMEVHEVDEGTGRVLRITRWHDYSNLPNIIDNAPAWWLERIAAGWRADGE